MMRQYIQSVFLLFTHYFQIRKLLVANNYTNMQIYNFFNWHHGYAYFIVKKENKNFFVKIDTKVHLLQNDLLVYKMANKSLKSFLVNIDNYFLLKNMQVIVFEFLENALELKEEHLYENPSLVNEIIEILRILNEQNIIHRDMKLDNFFLFGNNIKILDFTFATSLDKNLGFKELELTNKNYATLEFLGHGFNDEPFVWNDCIAIKNIFLNLNDRIDVNFEKLNCDKYSSYKLSPSKKYLQIRKIKIKIKNFLHIKHIHREINV